MNISVNENRSRVARAVGLIMGTEGFTVCLADGRKISVPYRCYPRLEHADMQQRDHFEVHANGRMLHWPDIDEDIEVQHIVEGRMPVKIVHEFMTVTEEPEPYGETSRGSQSQP